MRRSLLLVVLAVAGCGTAPSVSESAADVAVQVMCGDRLAPDECPEGDVRLEAADQAWGLVDAPGRATIPSTGPVTVRAVDADSCAVLVEFEAEPGHEYLVEIASDGFATAVDLAHENVAFEWGPELMEADPTGCG
jgi:hypothetical protein